jgi:hypothetical protein
MKMAFVRRKLRLTAFAVALGEIRRFIERSSFFVPRFLTLAHGALP